MVEDKKQVPVNKELELIVKRLEVVKKSGFGEVRILVKNGVVYRILSTEDQLIEQATNCAQL